MTFDLLRSGQDEEAMRVLGSADLAIRDGSVPILLLTLASVQRRLGLKEAEQTYQRAGGSSLDYCFPSRLEELLILEETIAHHPEDGRAYYLLGNFLYDRRRHTEAIAAWEKAAMRMDSFATLWRNLGIAYFNHGHSRTKSLEAFDRAFQRNPRDARILYQRDQLWKRVGEQPERRLSELLKYPELIQMRDDLSVELATLYNQTGRSQEALDLLLRHRFQPWEGGEGLVLAQYVRARLLLGRRALESGNADEAIVHFRAALQPPHNLGEAKHLLANQSEIYYWLGVVEESHRNRDEARGCWRRAARYKGDFQQMAVRTISGMTYWSALALQRLGEINAAAALFQQIYDYSLELESAEPKIDYFATSLPSMLLFEEDQRSRNGEEARYLRAQAVAGLGHTTAAEQMLEKLLSENGNHSAAADMLQQLRMMNPTGQAS